MCRPRVITGVLGAALTAAAAVGIGAHYLGFTSTSVAWIAAFTPVAVIVSVLALVLLILSGQRWGSAAAVLVSVVGITTQIPLYRGASTDAGAIGSVRVMQANIRLGDADLDALVDTARSRGADLLTVIELTEPAATGLAESGLTQILPHTCLRPRAGGGGAGIYSRYPLAECAQLDGFVLNNLRAVAEIPHTVPTAVYALHPLPPYPEPAWKWAYELKRLRPLFESERHPMIVGADFNSTYDHRQFRDLLAHSTRPGESPLLDAAQYVGAGVVPTYPSDRIVPAILAIDRILTRGMVPTSFERFDIPGSDHLGVIGNLAIPELNSNTLNF